MTEDQHFATAYALKADELYYGFPTRKRLRKDLPQDLHFNLRNLYGRILRYFFYLMINDIIENQVTFKLPPGTNAYI